jgi:hypothetical protein
MKRTSTTKPGKTQDDGAQADPAVAAFLRDTKHPLKSTITAVREIVLGVSPEIREGIKWNAPSFRTTDHFATFTLRAEDRVRLILHTGAKVKATAKAGVKVADPSGLIEWLAPDRGVVTFRDKADVSAKREAFEAVLREWIQWV